MKCRSPVINLSRCGNERVNEWLAHHVSLTHCGTVLRDGCSVMDTASWHRRLTASAHPHVLCSRAIPKQLVDCHTGELQDNKEVVFGICPSPLHMGMATEGVPCCIRLSAGYVDVDWPPYPHLSERHCCPTERCTASRRSSR